MIGEWERERDIRAKADLVFKDLVFYTELMPPVQIGSQQYEPHTGVFFTRKIVEDQNGFEIKQGTQFQLHLNQYGSVVTARIIAAEKSIFLRASP